MASPSTRTEGSPGRVKRFWSGFVSCFAWMKDRAHHTESSTEKQAAPKPEEMKH